METKKKRKNIQELLAIVQLKKPNPEEYSEWPNDIKMAIDYIFKHCYDNKLTLGALRKEIYGGNGNDFSTEFAYYVGTSPKAYINDLRIEVSKSILSEKHYYSDPILMIARELGFSGKGAFSHAFRQREGTSPGKWRKSHFQEK